MKLAMHQPNYLPWPGYFVKMAQCDIFVILDTVQFPRGRSVANRNLIKTPNGPHMLTVPVRSKGLGLQRYDEVLVLPGWKNNHLRSIERNYAKASGFKEIFPQLEQVLPDANYLLEINNAFIKQVYNWLKLDTRLVFLSSLPQLAGLRKNELIVALCEHFAARTYLSGSGGKAYHEVEIFTHNGLELAYLDYEPVPYPQLWGNFIPNLSVVDMLLNCGAEDTRRILLNGREYD